MAKTVNQKVVFKNTSPKILYSLYMNAKKHTASTGAVAQIEANEGSMFSAYDGYCTGANLKLVKDSLIVQSWRGSDWDESSPDSTLVLFFEAKGTDAVLHMTHAGLPDEQAESIAGGWHDFYWKPWKKYLLDNAGK